MLRNVRLKEHTIHEEIFHDNGIFPNSMNSSIMTANINYIDGLLDIDYNLSILNLYCNVIDERSLACVIEFWFILKVSENRINRDTYDNGLNINIDFGQVFKNSKIFKSFGYTKDFIENYMFNNWIIKLYENLSMIDEYRYINDPSNSLDGSGVLGSIEKGRDTGNIINIYLRDLKNVDNMNFDLYLYKLSANFSAIIYFREFNILNKDVAKALMNAVKKKFRVFSFKFNKNLYFKHIINNLSSKNILRRGGNYMLRTIFQDKPTHLIQIYLLKWNNEPGEYRMNSNKVFDRGSYHEIGKDVELLIHMKEAATGNMVKELTYAEMMDVLSHSNYLYTETVGYNGTRYTVSFMYKNFEIIGESLNLRLRVINEFGNMFKIFFTAMNPINGITPAIIFYPERNTYLADTIYGTKWIDWFWTCAVKIFIEKKVSGFLYKIHKNLYNLYKNIINNTYNLPPLYNLI